MGSAMFSILLPIALALVMFGLGLTLTVGDFTRVLKYPKAAVVALVCQMIVLPALCVGLILLFGLDGALAVGMMLLVASPGGTSANLAEFLDGGTSLGLQPSKFVQVFAIVLIPVVLGMAVRGRFTGWAERMRKPVKIGSAVVLVLVIAAAIAQEFRTLVDNIGTLGPVALALSVLSLAIGYFVPRLFQVDRGQSIASAMEIGIHNATLAIAVAISVLGDKAMAVPAGIYGVLMFFPAGIAAFLLSRKPERAPV
ncbi:bile acid:sodium symporter [Amycolatopsis orientalis]|uniref:Bile acid:sodium symporter n=1 Tax=Amycolatopsis orientalis TaxID=31958 RepID=A0A193BU14_AMYOR|nr:bile acid:sodium symporter family protein [Amycolatopsis orientalis]ANN15664.1 bile acid:sodium symporter [Amycolatopsis orientalis]